MKFQIISLIATFWVALHALQAQPKPSKPLEKATIQKALDTMAVGGQVSVTFQYKENEILGNILTYAQDMKKNEARRQVVLPLLKKNPDDFALNVEMYGLECAIAKDTSKGTTYKRKAYELIDAQIKNNPANGEAYFQKGKLLQSEFKFQEAFTEYGNALRNMPDSAKIYQKSGELFFFYAQYGQAKAYFEEGLNRDVSNLSAHLYFSMADMFNAMMSLSQAEAKGETITEAAQKSQQFTMYLEKAMIKYPDRQDLKDFKLYSRILWLFYKGFIVGASNAKDSQMDFSSKDFNIASFFVLDSQDLAELTELEKGFKQIIDQKKIPNTSLAHESLGLIALLQNKTDKAMQYFEKVAKINPEKSQNHYNMLFIHLLKKDYKKAEATLKRKMLLNKEVLDYQMLATVYERQKKYEKAKDFCKEGVKALPLAVKTNAMGDLKALWGMLEAITQNYADAEKYLQEALAFKDNDDELLYKIALVQLAQEKWTEGYSNLNKAAFKQNKGARKMLDEYFKF